MSVEIFLIPDFIKSENITQNIYKQWIFRKANSHFNRDKKYWENKEVEFIYEREDYRNKIHEAVVASQGNDFYTGTPLSWEHIGKFGKKEGDVFYSKKILFGLPTLDHYDRNEPNLIFVITGWAVNDAKNDLSYNELLVLCKKVLDNQEYCLSKIAEIKNR